MSIDLLAAAFWLDLEPAPKLVLLALCERADLRTGACWPGRDEIAKRTSISIRRVSGHVAALEAAGYIRSSRRPTGGRGRRETTMRLIDVQRVIREGEVARETFQKWRRKETGDESSPKSAIQGTLATQTGDDQAETGDDTSINGGRLGDREPSRNRHIEPSIEPSTFSRVRARAKKPTGKKGLENGNARGTDRSKSKPGQDSRDVAPRASNMVDRKPAELLRRRRNAG